MSASALAAAIKAQTNRPQGLVSGVGTVQVQGNLAEVTGITVDPIRVDKSSWGSPFVASVNAGSVNGKRVKVSFIAGQAIIDFVLGG